MPNDPGQATARRGRMARVSERARGLWALLIMFVIFVGVTVSGALYTKGAEDRGRADIERVQREQQQDLCDLIGAVVPSNAPPPASERERQRTEALERYRSRRC